MSKKRGKDDDNIQYQPIGGNIFYNEGELYHASLYGKGDEERVSTVLKVSLVFIMSALLGGMTIWSYEFDFIGVIVNGFILIGAIYLLYRFTGAHYNPAFTLGCIIAGRKEYLGKINANRLFMALRYKIAQFVGAGIGIFVTVAVLADNEAPAFASLNLIIDWAPALRGILIEFVAMTFFTLLFLSVTCKKFGKNDHFGITIGLVHIGLGIILGRYDGSGIATLNPAISVMSNFLNVFPLWSGDPWIPISLFSALMYYVVDMSAGLLGGLIYFVLKKETSKSLTLEKKGKRKRRRKKRRVEY